jgi:nucleotide-binding universal stress UspA family protein
MHRIMLATDFSERSDRALRRAVLLSRESGATLDLVHVVDNDRPKRLVEAEAESASLLLVECAHSLKSVEGVSCSTQVLLHDPFAGIAKAAAETVPDLLVIGPHRRQILRDAFAGTTAERTIRAVACPVLMVNGPPVGPYRHVLLTTDMSENSREALKRFEKLEIGIEGMASVVSVFDAPALRLAMSGAMAKEDREEYLNELRAGVRRDLAAFMASVGGRHAEPILRHEETTIAHDVLKVAEEVKADLIVVSTKGKGAAARILLGSVAEQVLRSSSVDVLAVAPLDAGS